ncbi:ribosomal RNA small subunit methyltransferase G [Abditibacteriota bacterium]|nr:ribosomal RNA small subunit methyltransferase G [Abditibacteriota bacterium]
MNPELETKLRALVAHLLEENQKFNLTGIKDPDDAWTKHVLDSLEGLGSELFDGNQTVVDVGTGAGFPGLVLALARPQLRVAFLEATRKKCAFIEATLEKFSIKGARIINERAEDAGQNDRFRAAFDVATARAVGSFAEVAELCLPLVRVGGSVVLWRGENAEIEAQNAEEALDDLGGFLRDVRPYELPSLPTRYHLITIEKVGDTPRFYPRRSGIPKQKPLA